VLDAAAADTLTLAVGVDADARAMADASRRAARNPAKGGLPNAVFVAAGVEMLPTELAGIADLVTVQFPWGSLLRGALGLDTPVAEAMARLVAPNGALELNLSIQARDTVEGRAAGPFEGGDVERVRAASEPLGLCLTEARPMSRHEIDALRSSWARRLRVGIDRPAWRLRLRRED
jgi:16S rRNA (adenine(1408)-N(1))-methyltransferase